MPYQEALPPEQPVQPVTGQPINSPTASGRAFPVAIAAVIFILVAGSAAAVLGRRQAGAAKKTALTSAGKGYVATVPEGFRIVSDPSQKSYSKYTVSPTEFIVPAEISSDTVAAAYYPNTKTGDFYNSVITDTGVIAVDQADPGTEHEPLGTVERLDIASLPTDRAVYRTIADGSVAMLRVTTRTKQVIAMIWGKGNVWRLAAAYGDTVPLASVLSTIDTWKSSAN